ncbi:MAG TPA: hypothetical protein VK524_09350 [Polyangiaceae bacterium]|nr:hypothetical protein [Polyangiaceae bacterium]
MADSRIAKAITLSILTALVLVPAIWLIYVLGLANDALEGALRDGVDLVEGPIKDGREPEEKAAKPALNVQVRSASEAKPRIEAPAVKPEPELRPEREPDKLLLGARQIEMTDPRKSREILEAVLQKEPRNERALRMLATKMLSDEKLARARTLAVRCLSVNITNYACQKVGQLVPALVVDPKAGDQLGKMGTIVDACLKATPDSAACLSGKLQLSLLRGKIGEAKPLARRLARVAPNAPELVLCEGRLAAAAGAYGKARVAFERACQRGEEGACFRAEVLRAEGF